MCFLFCLLWSRADTRYVKVSRRQKNTAGLLFFLVLTASGANNIRPGLTNYFESERKLSCKSCKHHCLCSCHNQLQHHTFTNTELTNSFLRALSNSGQTHNGNCKVSIQCKKKQRQILTVEGGLKGTLVYH